MKPRLRSLVWAARSLWDERLMLMRHVPVQIVQTVEVAEEEVAEAKVVPGRKNTQINK
jgi:hypothetical protein